MNKLDCLAMLLAATCHDLGHDGLMNSYHMNAITQRAVDSNDKSVQEHFHAAELYRVLSMEGLNFMDVMPKEHFQQLRKRIAGLILVTDMQHHTHVLATFDQIIAANKIKDGANVHQTLLNEDLGEL